MCCLKVNFLCTYKVHLIISTVNRRVLILQNVYEIHICVRKLCGNAMICLTDFVRKMLRGTRSAFIMNGVAAQVEGINIL